MRRSRATNLKSADSPNHQFLIVRHAESKANVDGVLAGRIDPTPLTKKGRSSAVSLTEVFAGFRPNLVLVSPLLRCRQTTELAGQTEYLIEERLIEMDYGNWSGRSLNALRKDQRWKEVQNAPHGFTFPRGESFQQAWDRIDDLLNELRRSDHRRIALVSHGDISRMMITNLLRRELSWFQKILIEPASHSLLIEADGRSSHGAVISYMNRIPDVISGARRSVKTGPSGYRLGGE